MAKGTLQRELRTWRWEIILDYPGRSILIAWVLKSGEPFHSVASGRCD
jgi:hypothetical protein